MTSEFGAQNAAQPQGDFEQRHSENLDTAGQDTPDVVLEAPKEPKSISETGISKTVIEALILKTMVSLKVETIAKLCKSLFLPYSIVEQIMEEMRTSGTVEILGSTGEGAGDQFRFTLTTGGRKIALEALDRNKYVGPAPVGLKDFSERVMKQSIINEMIPRERIDECFGDLVVPEELVEELGPAVNSGRAVLLYGTPGNGKSSLAERMGRMFLSEIYIPHCVEIGGDIIKLYDPALHRAVGPEEPVDSIFKTVSIEREDIDKRWVKIKRPLVIAGGELTLEMLDLQFNALSGFYEAPLHMKALNGIMMIDDFGRQLVSPESLLNRWIVPLEKRIDFLKLHTGKSFEIPFDALVVFSTNLSPKDLMDPAFLRRIPYKVRIEGPTFEDFAMIFQRVASEAGLVIDDETIREVAGFLEQKQLQLANYQPKFIIDQVVAACKYARTERRCDQKLINRAMRNLQVD